MTAAADFKGRLDSLMEESLSKYQGKVFATFNKRLESLIDESLMTIPKKMISDLDDYTLEYGGITRLAGQGATTPSLIPHKIVDASGEKKQWMIHSFTFTLQHYDPERFGWMDDDLTSGYAIDNYGNFIPYKVSTSGDLCGVFEDEEVPSQFSYPLTNSMIDLVKELPTHLGRTNDKAAVDVIKCHYQTLLKLAAKTIYTSHQVILQLRKELEEIKTTAKEL